MKKCPRISAADPREVYRMNLNRIVPKAGAAIVTVTVFLFAVFIIAGFNFGSRSSSRRTGPIKGDNRYMTMDIDFLDRGQPQTSAWSFPRFMPY